jgi:hypothetical protein
VDITIFQTADPYKYAGMLQVTSQTVTEFCRRHGHAYESYLGVKRGPWPWEAAYNRIIQLQELMDRGFRGWAVHMDADAYIVDLDFDLAAYLSDKGGYAAVLTPSMVTDEPWDINDGVGLFNLGHPLGRAIVTQWNERFAAVSDERLAAASDWIGNDDDQDLIQSMLRSDAELCGAIFLQSTDLMNSSFATFIRQHLRGYSTNFEERMEAIRRDVSAVMLSAYVPFRAQGLDDIIEAAYAGVFGRVPDEGGRNHAKMKLLDEGVAAGLQGLLRQMIQSDEFLKRGAGS